MTYNSIIKNKKNIIVLFSIVFVQLFFVHHTLAEESEDKTQETEQTTIAHTDTDTINGDIEVFVPESNESINSH